MPWGSAEEPDDLLTELPTQNVHIVSSDARPTKSVGTEFGQWRTFLITNVLGSVSSTPGAVRLCPRSLRRRRLRIIVNSSTGGNTTTEVAGTNPAAGTDFVYTNNSGGPQTVLAARFTFTADAVVANRFLSVLWKDAGGTIITQVSNGQAVVAGTSTTVSLFQGYNASWSAASGSANGPLPTTVTIPAGGTLTIHVVGDDVGDQLSAILLDLSSVTQSSQDGVIVGSSAFINSGISMTPGNTGGGYLQIGDNVPYESQQELWAAYPTTNVGPVLVSVCDEIYASDTDEHGGKTQG
jgi:hypothetical protein